MEDKAELAAAIDKYFSRMFTTVGNHYEFMSDHFKDLPTYSTWSVMGDLAEKAGGLDKAYRDYIAGNMLGTPEELIEHHRKRKELVGDYEMLANFSWGGLPFDLVHKSARLFADKVLPHLKS
jgi:hypothetical protein